MMTLDNVIHEEVLKWKRFGLFKLGMIQSFADACYNAYASLVATDVNIQHREHTFFAIIVDDFSYEQRVSVQFNYRIDVNMHVALVSLTCTLADILKPYFFFLRVAASCLCVHRRFFLSSTNDWSPQK